jgi:hypothetical protein
VDPTEIEVTKKASQAKPGNDLELNTQQDGGSVGVREAKQYVKGKIGVNGGGAGLVPDTEIMINALDFTKGGDEDSIEIIHGDTKLKVKKAFIVPTELFEAGVYNSEIDVNNNPKTGENTPDAVGAVIDRLTERIKEIVSTLEELQLFVKDNSALSHESLDKCIAELNTYVKSLETETEEGASTIINK